MLICFFSFLLVFWDFPTICFDHIHCPSLMPDPQSFPYPPNFVSSVFKILSSTASAARVLLNVWPLTRTESTHQGLHINNVLSFSQQLSVINNCLAWRYFMSTPALHAWDFLIELARSCAIQLLWIYPRVQFTLVLFPKHCFLVVVYCLWLLHPFQLLFHEYVWALEWTDVIEMSHLRPSLPQFLILYTLTNCDYLC